MKNRAALLPIFAITLSLTAQPADSLRLYGNAHPYLNDDAGSLKLQVSDLGDLKSAVDPPPLSSILDKAGDVVLQQAPRVPNLIAQEDVAAERVAKMSPFMQGAGRGTQFVFVDEGRLTPQNWKHFDYIVLAEHGKDGGTTFEESRRESGKTKEATTRGVGFGSLWLIFSPQHHEESQFRLVGTQVVNHRDTYVVAFAQDPKLVKSPGTLELEHGTAPLLYQGVAWIDQKTGNIIKLRTDLLSPLPSLQLQQVTSTIEFSEVKIPKFDTPLWLPKQVEVVWNLNGNPMGELHRYRGYHLFHATTKILPLV